MSEIRRVLSRKGYSVYRECPFAYHRQYVLHEKPAQPENMVNAVLGNVLGRIMEMFYNEELYRRPDALSVLLARVPEVFDLEEAKARHVSWTDARESRAEVLRLSLTLTPEMIRSIQHHRLIGAYARSEVQLGGWIDNWEVNGRADLIFTRGDRVSIIDGKSSKHREKYVDEDQLLFYAYLYFLEHGTLPERLGWFFYRFSGDRALDWIRCDARGVSGLKDRLLAVIAGIEAGNFSATPSREACIFCMYRESCLPRTSWEANKSAASKSKKGVALPPLPGNGPVVLSLDGD